MVDGARAAGPPLPRLRAAAARAARSPVPPTLAVGADLKNTFCLAEGRYAWLSQHVGDMDDLATLHAFAAPPSAAGDAHRRPTRALWSADRHPGYRSTALGARRTPAARPRRRVQHHHAHIAAVMAEHGLDGADAGARGRLRRHRLRHRRRGLGRRGAGRRLRRLRPRRPPAATCRCPAATPACAPVPDGAVPPAGAPACRGTTALPPRRAPARRRSARCCGTSSTPGRLRADVEHGPAVRRGRVAGRRPAGRGYEAQAAIELEGLARDARSEPGRADAYRLPRDGDRAAVARRPGSGGARGRGGHPRRRARRRGRRPVPRGRGRAWSATVARPRAAEPGPARSP